MKSLSESLFDQETNIKKDITFGDLFELDEYKTDLKKISADYMGHLADDMYKISDLYNKQLISKDSKIKGSSDEDIVKGLATIIQNIPITAQTNIIDLGSKLEKFEKYYKSFIKNSFHLRGQRYIWSAIADPNNPSKTYSSRDDFKIIDSPRVEIHFCRLTLKFKRK